MSRRETDRKGRLESRGPVLDERAEQLLPSDPGTGACETSFVVRSSSHQSPASPPVTPPRKPVPSSRTPRIASHRPIQGWTEQRHPGGRDRDVPRRAQRVRSCRVPQRIPGWQEGLLLELLQHLGPPPPGKLGARPGSLQRQPVPASVSGRDDVRLRAIERAWLLDLTPAIECRQPRLENGRRNRSAVDRRHDHHRPGREPARRSAVPNGRPGAR